MPSTFIKNVLARHALAIFEPNAWTGFEADIHNVYVCLRQLV